MRYRSITTARRKGLTLVEMMIALALSIFIMAILSEAFITGLNAFGNFKALADLDQRLRTAANIIRRDLKAPHFDGNRKLSECTVSGRPMPAFDGLNANAFSALESLALQRQLSQYRFKSPLEGFFSIEEWPNRPGPTPRITSTFEGQDSSDRPSYRDRFDVLHFTSRLEGNEPDKFFFGRTRPGSLLDNAGLMGGSTRYDAAGNNGVYSSQAAELIYFMGNDETAFLPGVDTAGGPVLTFNLYRQAWLLVPDRFSNGAQALGDSTYTGNPIQFRRENDVSAFQDAGNNFWYNTMASVQHRARRFPQNVPASPPYSPKTLTNGTLEGSDILLTNVISFNVEVFDPFAYKIPLGMPNGGPGSGRGAYVDIGDTSSMGGLHRPTAATAPGDFLTPVYGATLDTLPAIPAGIPDNGVFDTGTMRFEGQPGGTTTFSPAESPATHLFPFNSIRITIRVYEPKSRQTRQITIIQDM